MIEQGQFTLYATFKAHQGQYESMKAATLESFALTREAAGLLEVICLEPPKTELPFVLISIWRSKADFQAFLKSPPMLEYHSQQAVKTMFETILADATAEFYTTLDGWTAPAEPVA